MAVETNPIGGALLIELQTGTDPVTGNPVYKTRRYSSIKPASTDQNLFDVANTIAGLQQHPLSQVIHEVDMEITEVI